LRYGNRAVPKIVPEIVPASSQNIVENEAERSVRIRFRKAAVLLTVAHLRKYLNTRDFSTRGQQEIFLNGQMVRAITGCEADPVGLAMCSGFSNRRLKQKEPQKPRLQGVSERAVGHTR
jgi:hypothetical protein